MTNVIKMRNHKDKIINIGFHHPDDHRAFSDGLTCLSHALEAVEMPEAIDPLYVQKLQDLIYEAFHYGELIERIYFGGEWDVMNKEK